MAGVDRISLGALKSKSNIARHYARSRLTRVPGDAWVEDRRDGRLQGPFSGGGAERCAAALNDFVMRNAPYVVERLDGVMPFVAIDTDGVIIM